MSQSMTIEERVSVLERQVAELRQSAHAPSTPLERFRRLAGSFEDEPEFDEVVRLGREIRRGERAAEDAPE